jgi:hypothetical protein
VESRWIPLILAAGWLLVTLGIWGAGGQRWWIWPLSLGISLLLVGATYGWAMWVQLRAAAAAKAAPPQEAAP